MKHFMFTFTEDMLTILHSKIGETFVGFYSGKMLKNNVYSKVVFYFGDEYVEIRHAYQSIHLVNEATDFGVFSARKFFTDKSMNNKKLEKMQYSHVEAKIKDIKIIRVNVQVSEENEPKLSLQYDAGVVFELEDRTIVFEKGSWLGEDIFIHFTSSYQDGLIALEDEWVFEVPKVATYSRDIVSVAKLIVPL